MSKGTKHTPGPWKVMVLDMSDPWMDIVTEDGKTVVGDQGIQTNLEADANLIAAAPCLLEALEAVLEELRQDAETVEGEYGTTSPMPTFADMIQEGRYPGAAKAIKAIAKAKGETA